MRPTVLVALAASVVVASLHAAEPIRYRFSFPRPEHHWLQVDAVFPDLPPAPLELRMSRSSPGRYSLHDFSANVYDVHAFSSDGVEVGVTRPDPYGWTVPRHAGSLTLKYKVFGDFLDGTYLAVDSTHAHINMPAVIMWARGLDDWPATLTFDEPSGRRWQIATQLHPASASAVSSSTTASAGSGASTSWTFTAPNLQFLIDSPLEFSSFASRQFSEGGRTFRLAMHSADTAGDVDAVVADLQKVVREEGAIFGEFPDYEPGSYTFIVDSLPQASQDAMEHRNSTAITSRGTAATDRQGLLDSAAHEFFHSWNVERIRPKSLEPFDLERANMSDELWLGEGFTEYYGPLALRRAGVKELGATLQSFARFINSVELSPARGVRSAVDMSRLAVFSDRDVTEDRTNFPDTFISYYDFGGAIALALDLTLRERSDGRVSLDDFMRGLWRAYGKPGGSREGYVDHPYTMADLEAQLADVSSDKAFAHDFFARYIEGREVPDFGRLVTAAGLTLRKRQPGRASWGDVRFADRSGGLRLAEAPASNSPAYAAGLDIDAEVRELDGTRLYSASTIDAVLQRHRPGDKISIVFADRSGAQKTSTITLVEDPRLELVAVESSGGTLTPSQRTFRERWLGKKS